MSRRIFARARFGARIVTSVLPLTLACAPADAPTAPAEPTRMLGVVAAAENALTDVVTEPFGTFGDIAHVRHSGRFSGTTELGGFDMPFEVIAPADVLEGNGALLLEPPHFAFGPAGREGTLGREFVLGSGMAYAAVGFGTNGSNVLDPSVPDLRIAGVPVASPGAIDPSGLVDESILIQFVRALTSSAAGERLVGAIDRRYAYGISQTAAALLETLHHPDAQGLFDFTLLHLTLWNPPFEDPNVLDRLTTDFTPPDGVGRVAFVESEGDLLISDATQLRRAVGSSDYRVYEIAGASHVPTPLNPLDHEMVARAVFVGGMAWAEGGAALVPSRTLDVDASGADDPVYGRPTGILRDADLNAVGGVRLPEMELGTARFVAADFGFDPFPPLGFFGLVGAMVDLTCAPRPGEEGPRFRSHGAFVSAFVRQTNALVRDGLLLPLDGERLREDAAASDVGRPGHCDG